jgi:predicted ferric reductase
MTAPTRPVRPAPWRRRVVWILAAAAAAAAVRHARPATRRVTAAREVALPPPRGAAIALARPAPAAVVAGAGLAAAAVVAAPHLGLALDTPVGADLETGMMPDHGARHLPRTLWLAAYAIAIIAPVLLIVARDDAQPRPFIFELGSALGITALSLLALQLALPARLPVLATLGAEVAVRLHRRLADILLAAVAAHVAAVMVADPSRLQLLRFVGEPWRAQAAIGSVAALVVLAVTSVLRRRLRLPYVAWRLIHLVASALALILAVVHTVGVGRYLVQAPAVWALVGLTTAGLGALVVMRSGWIRNRSVRPYTVERIVTERGGAVTVALRAEGHRGQRFIPGQFAWLKLSGTRTMLAEHPFSYSSSAEAPDRPEFTMKTQAGFSARAAGFEPGTRLLVDGPHGAFRPRATSTGTLLVAGGIGITPSMSILRTAADRGDLRPYLLVYAARTLDGASFTEELERLGSRLRLTVVVVLSSPPPDWPGERGRLNAGVFDRHLPRDVRGWQFMACGSGPFVDGAITALEGVGIPGERVHAERFVEV